MTSSINQTLHRFANLIPYCTLLPILTLLPNLGGFHRTLQRVRLAYRGRLLLRKTGPVPFGTCICSNVETILSWTCHVYGPFEFRTSLDTSSLPLFRIMLNMTMIIYFTIVYIFLSESGLKPRKLALYTIGNGNFFSKIEKVPRGIRGEKSSKDMACSRNLVSTIGALASPKIWNIVSRLDTLSYQYSPMFV